MHMMMKLNPSWLGRAMPRWTGKDVYTNEGAVIGQKEVVTFVIDPKVNVTSDTLEN